MTSRRDVTPPKRYKAPLPRVLATFLATPYGVFIYGGARPGTTPTARLPLCDLWHLKKMLPGSPEHGGDTPFVWEDCNRMPKCSAEHAGAPESGPPLLRTPVAADRLVVGHDAHAWTFMEPSHIVVRHMHPMCHNSSPCTASKHLARMAACLRQCRIVHIMLIMLLPYCNNLIDVTHITLCPRAWRWPYGYRWSTVALGNQSVHAGVVGAAGADAKEEHADASTTAGAADREPLRD